MIEQFYKSSDTIAGGVGSIFREEAANDLINIYSEKDGVQLWGMFAGVFGYIDTIMMGSQYTRERPNDEGSIEVNATVVVADGSIQSHTTLHKTQEIIEFVQQELEKLQNEKNQ